jgi:CheY-like chemotaxis protein
VLEASNGKEALAVWEERSDIDLLFTDMVMPEGIDGLDLAKRMRQRKPELKVILSSGYSAEMSEKGLQEDSGIEFLAKPYQVGQLAATVRKCLTSQA